jgi:hypothetical protein
MFVRLDRLLRRVRQPASRAAEIRALRVRLETERSAKISDEERALASRVQRAKLALAALLAERGPTASCGRCAAGDPWPSGAHAGGACCSGSTPELFDDRELAALAHGARTRPQDLAPPPRADVHAGCAFRGERSCALDVAHRPARCVRYICDALWRELHGRGEMTALEARVAELDAAMHALTGVLAARVDAEVVAPLLAALEHAIARRNARPGCDRK